MTDHSLPWRTGFTALLVVAMAASTFVAVSISLIASTLIETFDVSRASIGLLVAANTVVGGLLSPVAGKVTDRIGGRRALVALLVASGLAYLALSVSPAFTFMFGAVVLAGATQAGGNPATNKLIATHVAEGSRGVITGVKQSGVQVGVFLGGILIPLGVATIGWRPTLAITAAVPLLFVPVAWWLLPSDEDDSPERAGDLPATVPWLTTYAALIGFGASYTFIVPLFAEESLGLSRQAGGLAVSLIGITALLARIGWARLAERLDRYLLPLLIISIGAVGAAGVMFASMTAAWLLWPGAVLTGLTSSSWNSVGMLAVMGDSGSAKAGRGTGMVMLGFLVGLGSGPPVYGWIVDLTGSYAPMWWSVLAAMALATMVAGVWMARGPRG